MRVGEKYFPGTNLSYEKYNEVIRRISEQEQCIFINLYEELNDYRLFYEDLFHPNIMGYKKIADKICKNLLNGGENQWKKK